MTTSLEANKPFISSMLLDEVQPPCDFATSIHLRGFRLLAFSREPDRLVVACERITPSAPCPLCGKAAHRIHSRYQRTVADVPVQRTAVLLVLHVRKFYCDQPTCPRRIFTERLPQVTAPHGRLTFALQQWLARVGQEHGGAPGARSAKLLGLQVSGRVILRLLHALPLLAFPAPRVIGLDDWAWKRRQRYGAIVVDLERGKPIALLAERSQTCVKQWLKRHPTIQIVARDRTKRVCCCHHCCPAQGPTGGRPLAPCGQPDRTPE